MPAERDRSGGRWRRPGGRRSDPRAADRPGDEPPRGLSLPPGRLPGESRRSPAFRRAVELLAALLVLSSLYAFYRSMAFLGGQDYVAALLVAVVGIALVRSGVELARSALCE